MTPNIEQYKNVLIVLLYLTLFIRTQVSGIGGFSWKFLMRICISGSISFFIYDTLVTSSHYSYKIQQKLSFYMVFPAVISLVLYQLNEYNKAYNIIIINIIISIAYITIGIIAIVGICMLKFHEKYTQKMKIQCDNCKNTYIVRIREYNRLRKYKYDTSKGKAMIICQKCLNDDPKYEKLSLAPDFTKINHKAKRLAKERITTEIDGQKVISQVSDVEVDP